MKTAPHKKWFDELTVELRLNNATGKEIGDALAAVEEFVADSGQSPAEAFGTPREYAAQLVTAAGTAREVGDNRLRITWAAASLLAFLVFSNALTPWIEGERMPVGGVQLLSLAVMVALVFAMPLYLNYMVRNLWALIALPIVGIGMGVLTAVTTPRSPADALFSLAPLPVLLMTTGIMVLLSISGTLTSLRESPDPVVWPFGTASPSRLKARAADILAQWLFPILAVVLLAMTLLIHALN